MILGILGLAGFLAFIPALEVTDAALDIDDDPGAWGFAFYLAPSVPILTLLAFGVGRAALPSPGKPGRRAALVGMLLGLLVIFAFVGYVGWSVSHNGPDPPDSVPAPYREAPTPSRIAPDTTALSLRARQIVDALVADAAVLDRGDTPSGLAGLRHKGYLTSALVQQEEAAVLEDYDLMSCSQNPLDHYDLGTPSINDNRGQVEVSGSYSTGPFVFTYEFVRTASGWKLDRVVCPPP